MSVIFDTFAEEVYAKLEPLTYDEAAQDDALKTYVTAIGYLLQEVDDYVRDDDDGQIGWSMLVDLDRVPDKFVHWLGQFVGVTSDVGLTIAQQKDQVETAAGWKRGTPSAIIGAAQALLTGNKTVVLRERFGGPYKLQVLTLKSQTPVADWDTTNLLTDNQASWETDTSGWDTTSTFWINTGATYTRVLTDFIHGGAAAQVVCPGALSQEGIRAQVAVLANKTYTFSCYVKQLSGTAQLRIGLGDGTIGSSSNTWTPTPGVWQRRSTTLQVFSNATTQIAVSTTGAGGVTTFLVDAAQVEAWDTVTPFTLGSRPAGQGPVGNAIRSQKPAGITLTFTVVTGQDYQQLFTNFATDQLVFTTYATYQGVTNNAPGT